MSGKIDIVVVRQLKWDGKTDREFKFHVPHNQLDSKLDSIERAYNMEHTMVLVNGIAVR